MKRISPVIALLRKTVLRYFGRLLRTEAGQIHRVHEYPLGVAATAHRQIIYIGYQTMPWTVGMGDGCIVLTFCCQNHR